MPLVDDLRQWEETKKKLSEESFSIRVLSLLRVVLEERCKLMNSKSFPPEWLKDQPDASLFLLETTSSEDMSTSVYQMDLIGCLKPDAKTLQPSYILLERWNLQCGQKKPVAAASSIEQLAEALRKTNLKALPLNTQLMQDGNGERSRPPMILEQVSDRVISTENGFAECVFPFIEESYDSSDGQHMIDYFVTLSVEYMANIEFTRRNMLSLIVSGGHKRKEKTVSRKVDSAARLAPSKMQNTPINGGSADSSPKRPSVLSMSSPTPISSSLADGKDIVQRSTSPSLSQPIKIPENVNKNNSHTKPQFVTSPPLQGSPMPRRMSCPNRDRNRNGLTPISPRGFFAGSLEESLLSAKMPTLPIIPLQGFCSVLTASGRGFYGPTEKLPVDVIYYQLESGTPVPYVGTINLPKPYKIPAAGLVQLTVVNPSNTPIKVFLVKYDVSQMPIGHKTCLRQTIRTSNPPHAMFYAIQIQIKRLKRNKIYLYKRIRVIFPSRTPDDTTQMNIEYDCPQDPQYFKLKSELDSERQDDNVLK